MPVIRTSERALRPDNRPEWSDMTRIGVFRVRREGGRFDRHYHDCDEYWLVFAGKAKIATEGKVYYVGPGDIVCTRAGDEHDVLEVYEDLEAFFVEGPTPVRGRFGHLYRDEEATRRHDVPALPVPEDFPWGQPDVR